MKKAPKKTQQIDTVLTCRTKANAWGKDEDKETREALFNYLLMRARCQRKGDISLVSHVNAALELYAHAAKRVHPPYFTLGVSLSGTEAAQ